MKFIYFYYILISYLSITYFHFSHLFSLFFFSFFLDCWLMWNGHAWVMQAQVARVCATWACMTPAWGPVSTSLWMRSGSAWVSHTGPHPTHSCDEEQIHAYESVYHCISLFVTPQASIIQSLTQTHKKNSIFDLLNTITNILKRYLSL